MKTAFGSTGQIVLALLLSFSSSLFTDVSASDGFEPIDDTCEDSGLIKIANHAASYFCTRKLQASIPDVDCSVIKYEVVRAAIEVDPNRSWDKYATTIAVTDKDNNCLIAFDSHTFALPDWEPLVNEIQVAKCQDVEYKGKCTRAIQDETEEKEHEGETQGGPEGGASESIIEDIGYDAGEKDGEQNTDLGSDVQSNVDESSNSTMNWPGPVFDTETPVQGNSSVRAENASEADEEVVDEEIEVWEEEIEDGLLQVANVTVEDQKTETFWEAENATVTESKETHEEAENVTAVDSKETHEIDWEEDTPVSQNTTDINLSDLLEKDEPEMKNASTNAEYTTAPEQEGDTHEIGWDTDTPESENRTETNFDEDDSRVGASEMKNASTKAENTTPSDEERPSIDVDAEGGTESEASSPNATDQGPDNTAAGLTDESPKNEPEVSESDGKEVDVEEAEKIEAEEALLEELEEDLYVEDESLWEFAGKTEECSRFGVAEAEGIVFKCGLTAYVCGKSLQFREKFLLLLEDNIIDGCELGETDEILSSHAECDAFPSNEHYLKLDGTHKESKKVVCPNGLPLSSYYMFCSEELDNYYCDGDRCETCEEIERQRRFLRH